MGVALPRLQSILGQLKATGVEHARGVCRRVLQQATRHTEVRAALMGGESFLSQNSEEFGRLWSMQ